MNASTIVADRLIERGIYLERYKSGFNGQILDALETLENDLTKELAVAFSKGGTLKAQTKRLENLLSDTREIIKTAYKDNAKLAGDELLRLAQNEQTYVVGAMNHAIGIDLAGSKIVLNPLIVGATARQIASGIYDRTLNYDELKALADGTLIQGAKSAEWWSRQSADLTQKFSDQMRAGVLRGETLDQLVARVRGTQARLYADGIMQGTRRATEALVRTSVQAVANSTRLATFEANSDLISAIMWSATLDSRTCWTEDTLITMADGSQRRIADIKDGDWVMGGLSGRPCRVLGSVITEVNSSLAVVINGCYIGSTTDEHLMLTGFGWHPAKDFCLPAEVSERQVLCRNHPLDETAAQGAHERGNVQEERRIVQRDSEAWGSGHDGACDCGELRGSVRDGETLHCGTWDAGTGRIQHDHGRGRDSGDRPNDSLARGSEAQPAIQERPGVLREDAGEGDCRRTESIGSEQGILCDAGGKGLTKTADGVRVVAQHNECKPKAEVGGNASASVEADERRMARPRISVQGERGQRGEASGVARNKPRVGGTCAGEASGSDESKMGRPCVQGKDEAAERRSGDSREVCCGRENWGEVQNAGGNQEPAGEGADKLASPMVQPGDTGAHIVVHQAQNVEARHARSNPVSGRVKIVSLTIEGDESYVAGSIIVHNTPICMALSGKLWEAGTMKPIGHNLQFPGPTAHWGERSTQVSVLRSLKDISAAMDPGELDREFKRQLEKQGFTPEEIAGIKRNTRASMDGQVPADITFDKWLSGKAPSFQDELLGKGRGKLFRDGKITLTDLIDQSGRPLTIDELERLSQPRPKQKPPKL